MTRKEYLDSKNDAYLNTIKGEQSPFLIDLFNRLTSRVPSNKWNDVKSGIQFIVRNRRLRSGGYYIDRPISYVYWKYGHKDYYRREVVPSEI